jgi:hypothetical protein
LRFRNRRGDHPDLLRNNIDGEELESEFSGLCVNPGRFLVLPTLLLFLKDGGVVWLLGGGQLIDNPDKLMGGSRKHRSSCPARS